jgi:hypothetical protein
VSMQLRGAQQCSVCDKGPRRGWRRGTCECWDKAGWGHVSVVMCHHHHRGQIGGAWKASREKAAVSISREGRVRVQRLGCKRGRWKKKKNEKMRKHTSLAAYHFLPDPLNMTLDMMSCRVPEVAIRKGGWWRWTRKCVRWHDSEVTMKKMMMKQG